MRHLKVETSLQQLVHSLRRQGTVGQEECGESLVGSQVFFHLEIYNGTKNTEYYAKGWLCFLDYHI